METTERWWYFLLIMNKQHTTVLSRCHMSSPIIVIIPLIIIHLTHNYAVHCFQFLFFFVLFWEKHSFPNEIFFHTSFPNETLHELQHIEFIYVDVCCGRGTGQATWCEMSTPHLRYLRYQMELPCFQG